MWWKAVYSFHMAIPVLFSVAFTASVCGVTGSGVSLRLHLLDGLQCSRGDTGLTQTSISVQYRVQYRVDWPPPERPLNLSVWNRLAVIDPEEGFDQTKELPEYVNITESDKILFSNSSVEGVQFRLLQLEHGGGSCNCWTVEEFVVLIDNDTGLVPGSGSGSGSGSISGSARLDTDFGSSSGSEIPSSGDSSGSSSAFASDLGSKSGSGISGSGGGLGSGRGLYSLGFCCQVEIDGLGFNDSGIAGSGSGSGSGSGLESASGRADCGSSSESGSILGSGNTGSGSGSGVDPVGSLPEIAGATFCGGSASKARGFISEVVPLLEVNETSFERCPGNSDALVRQRRSPLCKNCSTPRIEMSYTLNLNSVPHCGGPDGVQEGIEFAMRIRQPCEYTRWIPLRLTKRKSKELPTDIFRIRGYDVEVNSVPADAVIITEVVTICGETLLSDDASEVQFRWMNTVGLQGDTLDTWALLNATAHYISSDGNTTILFDHDNETMWHAIRNGNPVCVLCGSSPCNFGSDYENQTMCEDLPCNVFGYGNRTGEKVQSNIALTWNLSLPEKQFTPCAQLIPQNITNSTILVKELLDMYFKGSSTVEPHETLAILLGILDKSTMPDIESTRAILQKLEDDVIAQKMEVEEPEVIGSLLLTLVDRVALEVFPEIGDIATENIAIQTQLISADVEGYTATINSEDFYFDMPKMSIQIPPELIELFVNSRGLDREEIRVISELFHNVQHLFPEGKPGQNDSMLGPGIVSTGLQCGDSLCNSTEANLTDPVRIIIEHSKPSSNFVAECVFWEFLNNESSSLSLGQWTDAGCEKNLNLSDNSRTVCECNHLTHFAILLSPVSLENLNKDIKISLTLIGYVGTTISLIAMAITVLIFISIRSLHNMRNYIHIHLCINLMIAQLIFVIGIDKFANDHVPVYCQAIAVLLHYFFLVSFMWMLMEGVVLYVVLVFVFVENTKFYILAFTIASYGIPLLYMGLLSLPLGFGLNNYHYGSFSMCFLNPETHFIWAFIAPVIVIISMNFVLLLIVAKIMWKHQKRRTDKTKAANVRRWLRSAIFLVLVMGITWIVGVLVVEVEKLFLVAYIFTIMVAFQGLTIFLIFVVLSQQVRDVFKKWWNVKVNESTILNKYFFGDTLASGNSSKGTGPESEKKDGLPFAEELASHKGESLKGTNTAKIIEKMMKGKVRLKKCKVNELEECEENEEEIIEMTGVKIDLDSTTTAPETQETQNPSHEMKLEVKGKNLDDLESVSETQLHDVKLQLMTETNMKGKMFDDNTKPASDTKETSHSMKQHKNTTKETNALEMESLTEETVQTSRKNSQEKFQSYVVTFTMSN